MVYEKAHSHRDRSRLAEAIPASGSYRKIVDQGYASATIQTYEGAARLFREEIARRGLRKGGLAGQTLSATHVTVLKAMHPNKYNQKRFYPERFIDALVEAGVAERPKPKALTPLDRLQAEYESYLRDQRGQPRSEVRRCSTRFCVVTQKTDPARKPKWIRTSGEATGERRFADASPVPASYDATVSSAG